MIQMNVFEKNKLSMHSLSSRSAVEERNKSYSNIVHVQCIMVHIFQKAQVALNKNAHNLQHHFGAQFFMLFHMVWFILFGVLGQETTFSLVEVLQQPIRNFHFKVFRAITWNKMDRIMWKSLKNCVQKWCRSLCAFLYETTCAFGKMWGTNFARNFFLQNQSNKLFLLLVSMHTFTLTSYWILVTLILFCSSLLRSSFVENSKVSHEEHLQCKNKSVLLVYKLF